MTVLEAQLSAQMGSMKLHVQLSTGAEPLVIVGPNGAGKSSLLLCLLGIVDTVRGSITIGERVLLQSDKGVCVPIEQRRMGYVPQDYGLFPTLTVRENIDFALRCAHPTQSAEQRRGKTNHWLAELGVTAYANRLVTALSGGEKQRVALARALSVEPSALLLDEPLAALAVDARRNVRSFLAEYLQRISIPTVIVTHDPVDAQKLAKQIVVLEHGTVVQRGTWAELAQHPATDFVREFVRSES